MTAGDEHIDDRRQGLSPAQRALLEQRLAGATIAGGDERIPRRAGAEPAPLSFAQQRLWLLDLMEGGGPTYNVPYVFRVEGPLSLPVLERVLGEIVRRHEVLRTTVRLQGDTPVQAVAEATPVVIRLREIGSTAAAEREASVLAFIREETQRPFALDSGPLMRVAAIRLSDVEHILALTFHHIVFDGWSAAVFFREMEALYPAFADNRPSPLQPLPIQYADYAVWQRRWLSGAVLGRQLEYWRSRLGGELPLLELRGDRPGPARQSFRGTTHIFTIERETVERLKRLSQAEGVTLYMTTLAAFLVFLARYTGGRDLLIGTPVAGRMRREIEDLIGFFVNTLVIRTDLTGDPTFRELLGRTRESALGALDHQDVPFEKLVEELHPGRMSTRTPLFQAMFVLQTASGEDPQLPGISFTRLDTDTGTAKFDLTLSLTEKKAGLTGWLEGSADIFDYESVVRMAGHFGVLLRSIIEDPSAKIGALPLMTASERHRVLHEWNETTVPYPRDAPVQQVFEEQALARDGETALRWGKDRMTYGELNRKANRLARYLQRHGAGPESPVAICLERSPGMIVAMLGILKAGGTYIPLDPALPRKRIELIVREAGVRLILTDREHRDIPGHGSYGVVAMDEEEPAIEGDEETNLPLQSGAGSAAYVMFTSGTTGTPRGVCVIHRGIVRLVCGARYAHFGPGEVFLHYAPPSFDAATFEVWGALLSGGSVAIAPPGALSLEELASVITSHGATTVWLTAPLFHMMVDGPIECFSRVRQVLAGGDVLSPQHVKKFVLHHPGCRLINGYGPTENTTFTCCYEVGDGRGIRATVPIGRPVENTTVYILDDNGQPVPPGVVGELWTGGDGLARGYLGQPELTSEKFIDCRIAGEKPERLYRTGDFARYLVDGTIEFVGRRDLQVKLRGYRIELGDVEAAMRSLPFVAEAAAVVREDTPGDRRLVVYWVPRPGQHGEDADLRARAREELPAYMVPSAFVRLAGFSVSASGKIDRRALPVPVAAASPGPAAPDAEPTSAAEVAIAKIWMDVLRLPSVARDRNFFDLGGHSLLAMQAMTRIREAFGIDLPLTHLFDHPTIEALALAVEARLMEDIEKTNDSGDPAPEQ